MVGRLRLRVYWCSTRLGWLLVEATGLHHHFRLTVRAVLVGSIALWLAACATLPPDQRAAHRVMKAVLANDLDAVLVHLTEIPADQLGAVTTQLAREGVLQQALQTDNLTLLKLLLDEGIDPNVTALGNGRNALHEATRTGRWVAVKMLLDSGSDPSTRTRRDLLTPLHIAAARGSVLGVLILLNYGASSEARDKNGNRPADLANLYGNIGIARRLQNR